MPRQLTLDLPATPAQGRGDFFVSPANQTALASIEAWALWPNGKLVLTGPEGSGKTHLAHVWAGLTGARVLDAADLPNTDITELCQTPVVVEDADRIAGRDAAEQALFHLHNLALAEDQPLLITARTAPSRWGVTLPDLASRLQATTLAHLDAADDALLAAVLVKLFDDRQITVPPTLINYLIPRIDRSLARAADLVLALDRTALAEKRAITRGLAARLLDNPGKTGA